MAAPTATIDYIWPPGFVEGTDTADPNQRRACLQLTLEGTAATDATATTLVDKSDWIGPASGAVPGRIRVDKVEWNVNGFNYVQLEWNHTTPDVILKLGPGSGEIDYRSEGGYVDPNSAGGTGDVDYLTDGAADGDTAIIKLWVYFKE